MAGPPMKETWRRDSGTHNRDGADNKDEKYIAIEDVTSELKRDRVQHSGISHSGFCSPLRYNGLMSEDVERLKAHS